MTIKRMLEYWNLEGILVRNDEMIVLKSLQGPEVHSYFARLEQANVELEFKIEPINRELLNNSSIQKFEKKLIEALELMQVELKNDEPLPQQWKNRKK